MADSSALAPGAPPGAGNLPELSVSELAHSIKRTMETNYERVRVRGELGRVTIAKSGHFYADLKDEGACLGVVMWKSAVGALRFRPAEGLEVVVEGKISTFPNKSAYQLVAERMEPAGVGALLAQLERLKAKLAGEGLFEAGRKKAIPFLPAVIGVITSPTGAVIRDILHRLEERFPRRVLLWPVVVQGEHAPAQVAAAIAGFNRLEPHGAIPRPDVLIVARGGGSIEDLWAFNEEVVVRAAAASAIPLISAVGHETDTTLIDFAADRRAPTPTAAAEMAVPVRADLVQRVETGAARLAGAAARGLDRRRTELRAAGARLPRPEALLGLIQQRFDRAGENLGRGLLANTRAAEAKFARLGERLRPDALRQDIARRRMRAEELGQRLSSSAARLLEARGRAAAAAGRVLETLSHKSALARGFALVERKNGALVRRADDLSVGERVRLRFADGEAGAVIGEGGGPARRKPGPEGPQGSLF